ncbi:MAG TPA: hypothetical protein VMX35_15345 [Acidobacteriota bacterium]|nr:hypothetical protein [Acidobacteriota bacterium]
MRRFPASGPVFRDPAILRYDPRKTYVFYMPGVRVRGFVYAFLMLGLPGVILMATYRGGLPGTEEMLAMALLVILISGFAAQYFANRVLLGPEELLIRKEHHEFIVRLFDIEDAFIADSLEEVDAVLLPEEHFPMEFETHDNDIIVLVMRDGFVSRSTAEKHNGILTKSVSFNVSKPERFLSFLKMRV